MTKLTSFKGKSRWDMPVYVATLASGEVARCSFWSPSAKPLDIAHGRAVAAYQCGEDGQHEDSAVLVPLSFYWTKTADLEDLGMPDDFAVDGPFCPLTEDIRPYFESVRPDNRWRPLPPKIPATIVKGHVEYNGKVYGDTMAPIVTVWPEGEEPKRTKAGGPTLAECRAALQQIVNMGNSPNPPPPAAMARYAAAVLGIEMEEAPRLRAVA